MSSEHGLEIRLLEGIEAVDLEPFYEIGIAMMVQSYYGDMPFNLVKAKVSIRNWIDDDNRCVAIAYLNGLPAGVVIGYCYTPWFSDTIMAQELLTLVDPRARGQGHGKALYNFFWDWAMEKGASYIGLSTSTGIGTDAARRIFEELGLELQAYTYRGAI